MFHIFHDFPQVFYSQLRFLQGNTRSVSQLPLAMPESSYVNLLGEEAKAKDALVGELSLTCRQTVGEFEHR